jgi:glycosyltransferase involved in cell wall biosynthesis
MLAEGRGEPSQNRLNATPASADVAVVIPAYNHARFLGEAIASVLLQTRPADEIVVVDDGSTDNPAAVVEKFPGVRLIRTENRGASAARNTALRSCKTDYIVFFDADDRLFPTALETGLACMADHPNCAFVYGSCQSVSEDGHFLWSHIVKPASGDAFPAFLRRNQVGGIMTVLFRRDCLLAVNGFDETLRHVEDYDLYLRMARKYPVASHAEVVGEYRRHSQGVSNDHVAQLRGTLLALNHHAPHLVTSAHRTALLEGRRYYRKLYVARMLSAASVRWRERHNIGILATDLLQAARWAPIFTVRKLLGSVGRRAGTMVGLHS